MYLLVCAELQTNLSHRMQSFIKSNCFGRCESMHMYLKYAKNKHCIYIFKFLALI